MNNHHIVMLLSNPFQPDPRVLKEARSLVQAGYKVTVICWDRKGEFAAREQVEGFDVSKISDVTPLPHNGCKPPKRRRV